MEPSQSRIIRIPARFTGTQRKAIGEAVVNFIKQRTQSGIDIDGNLFSTYSKNYEKTGLVDLTVSEQMLNSLEFLSHGPGYIRVGFSNTSANDKARWIQSPYGIKLGNQPVRSFVGISATDLNIILDRF